MTFPTPTLNLRACGFLPFFAADWEKRNAFKDDTFVLLYNGIRENNNDQIIWQGEDGLLV